MTYLKAINIEKTSTEFGKIISTNKTGKNKGLSIDDFIKNVKNQTCYSFRVEQF